MLLKTTYNVRAPVLICTISMATLNILYHCVMVIQNHCFDHILFKHVHHPHALDLDLQKLHVYLNIFFTCIQTRSIVFERGGGRRSKKKNPQKKGTSQNLENPRGGGGGVV